MIWIIKGSESHEIISANVCHEKDKSELWVTRPNGKNLKVYENVDVHEVNLYKEAIDFAIEQGEKAFRID